MRALITLCLFLLVLPFAHAEVIDIDNAQLDKLMKTGVPLIDIRLPAEWEETGIIAGSKLLTFFDERGKVDAPAWLDKAKAIAKPNEPVIVICRSGNRTKAASQFLSQQAGYTTVYNVKMGIKGWVSSGAPLVPVAPTLMACRTAKTC